MDGGRETTDGRGLKKGPWTTAEDEILKEYVRIHGEGNWNAVQKNTGLLRCGKSCRLRWANHLRPNLKKGSFSPDEERIIIELHAKFGNKWARMASQLHGRTDNEIKNYWNTRMKRRQRAGLPLYPQETHHHYHHGITIYNDEFEFQLNSLQFPNQLGHDDQNHQNMIQYSNSSNNTSSPSSSFSSLSSHQPSKRLCLDPLISTNSSLNQFPNSSMNYQMFSSYNNTTLGNDSNQFGFSLPLSSSSSSNHLPELLSENSETNNYNKNDHIDGVSYSSLLMGDHEMMRPISFPLGLELPSNQTSSTPSFTSNNILEDIDEPHARNSGLLDALLEESQALSRGGISKDIRVSRSDDLCDENQDKKVNMEFENRLLIDHSNSNQQSSFEANPNLYKEYNEPSMVKATSDDDDDLLMSLLNNFPSTTPLPDWYRMTEMQSELSPSGNHRGGNNGVEPSSGLDPMASLESCYWSNMPRIC